jgi:hypothetical protein
LVMIIAGFKIKRAAEEIKAAQPPQPLTTSS